MLSVTVSVYTNTAFSVDRFVAIKFPLKLLQTTRKHVLWVIAVIWIVSGIVCSVQLAVARAAPDQTGTIVCSEIWPDPDVEGVNYRQVYTVAVLIITYVIPVLLIMTMYILVCLQLWYRTTPGVEDHARNAKQMNSKRKVRRLYVDLHVQPFYTNCLKISTVASILASFVFSKLCRYL